MKYRILIFLFTVLSVNVAFAQWPPRYVLADVGVFDDFIIVNGDTIRGAAYVNGDTIFTGNGDYAVISGGGGSGSTYNLFGVSSVLSVSADTNQIITVSGFDSEQREGFFRYEVRPSAPSGATIDSLSVIPLSNGNYAVLRPQNNTLLASNFGVKESNSDNGPACQKMYNYAKLNGYAMLFDVPGVYRFETTAFDDNGNAAWDIHIEAVDGVVLEQYSKSDLFFNLKNQNIGGSYSLLGEQPRGQTQLKFVSTAGLGPSDIITIESDSVVTGLGFKKADVVEIDYVLNDSVVILKDSLLFAYEDGESMNFIRIHKYHKLTIKNIDIRQLYDNESTTGGAAGVFWGFNDVVFEDITLKADTLFESSVNDGFLLTHCINVNAQRLRFEGMRYGWLVNYGLNITMRDAVIEHSRHLVATSTWSKNIYIDGVYSYKCGSPVEAHYGWNYTFRNFRGDQEGDLNIRAFGVLRLEDCYIRAANCPTCSSYSLIGYHFARNALDSTFMYLVDNTHIRISNVIYEEEGPYGQYKGLTASSYQTLTIANCVAANMGGYENSNQAEGVQVLISNSMLGRAFFNGCGDDNVTFDNCIFDRNRFNGNFTELDGQEWLISADAGTKINFDGCEFYGTDSVDLVNHWVLSGLKFRFNDCTGANFKDLATRYTYANNLPYPEILTANNTDLTFLQSAVMDSVRNNAGTFDYNIDFRSSLNVINEGSIEFSDETLRAFYHDEENELYRFELPGNNDVQIYKFVWGVDGQEWNAIGFERSSGGFNGWIGNRGGDDLGLRSRDDYYFYANADLVLEIGEVAGQYAYRFGLMGDGNYQGTNPTYLSTWGADGRMNEADFFTFPLATGLVGGDGVLINKASGGQKFKYTTIDSLFQSRTLSGETTLSGSLIETNKQTITAASDTLTTADYIAYVDATSNTVDVYLPDAATADGSVFIIQAIDATNTITIIPLAGNVNGAASITLSAAFDYYEIHCHNGNYYARQ